MPRYLLDVNILIPLLDLEHVHHGPVYRWFNTPGREWAICPFTEAGFLRHMIREKTGNLTFAEATALLARLAEAPGYSYQPITSDWQTLCAPLAARLFGHQQVTDAYLLGLAIEADLILVTFDKAILHLAGAHARHVLVLSM